MTIYNSSKTPRISAKCWEKGILKTKVVRQKRQNPKISSHFRRF